MRTVPSTAPRKGPDRIPENAGGPLLTNHGHRPPAEPASQVLPARSSDIVDDALTGSAQTARMQEQTPDDPIELWLEALAAERGTAASSLGVYRTSARCWADFLASRSRTILDASRDDFSAYLGHLDDRHFSEATVAHRRTVVRSIHRFLIGEGLADTDPSGLASPMKRPSRLPLVLTIAEVDRLL